MSRNAPGARWLAAGLAALVGMTLSAGTVAAAPARPIAAAAEAQVAALPAATLAQTPVSDVPASPSPSPSPSRPFFRSGKGALAGVLLAGMIGYTVYSFSNDRVKSPAR